MGYEEESNRMTKGKRDDPRIKNVVVNIKKELHRMNVESQI